MAERKSTSSKGGDRRQADRRQEDRELRNMALAASKDAKLALEKWGQHELECAQRFKAIQEQTQDIPRIVQWFKDKEERERKVKAWVDEVLKDGTKEAVKWALKVAFLLAIAGTGATGLLKALGN